MCSSRSRAVARFFVTGRDIIASAEGTGLVGGSEVAKCYFQHLS